MVDEELKTRLRHATSTSCLELNDNRKLHSALFTFLGRYVDILFRKHGVQSNNGVFFGVARR